MRRLLLAAALISLLSLDVAAAGTGPNTLSSVAIDPTYAIRDTGGRLNFTGVGTSSKGYAYGMIVCNSSSAITCTSDTSMSCPSGSTKYCQSGSVASGALAYCINWTQARLGIHVPYFTTCNSNGDKTTPTNFVNFSIATWANVSNLAINLSAPIYADQTINHSATTRWTDSAMLEWNASNVWSNLTPIHLGPNAAYNGVYYGPSDVEALTSYPDRTIGYRWWVNTSWNNTVQWNVSTISTYSVLATTTTTTTTVTTTLPSRLEIKWTQPTVDSNHTQYVWQQYQAEVCCRDKDCGEVNATLDPALNISQYVSYSDGWCAKTYGGEYYCEGYVNVTLPHQLGNPTNYEPKIYHALNPDEVLRVDYLYNYTYQWADVVNESDCDANGICSTYSQLQAQENWRLLNLSQVDLTAGMYQLRVVGKIHMPLSGVQKWGLLLNNTNFNYELDPYWTQSIFFGSYSGYTTSNAVYLNDTGSRICYNFTSPKNGVASGGFVTWSSYAINCNLSFGLVSNSKGTLPDGYIVSGVLPTTTVSNSGNIYVPFNSTMSLTSGNVYTMCISGLGQCIGDWNISRAAVINRINQNYVDLPDGSYDPNYALTYRTGGSATYFDGLQTFSMSLNLSSNPINRSNYVGFVENSNGYNVYDTFSVGFVLELLNNSIMNITDMHIFASKQTASSDWNWSLNVYNDSGQYLSFNITNKPSSTTTQDFSLGLINNLMLFPNTNYTFMINVTLNDSNGAAGVRYYFPTNNQKFASMLTFGGNNTLEGSSGAGWEFMSYAVRKGTGALAVDSYQADLPFYFNLTGPPPPVTNGSKSIIPVGSGSPFYTNISNPLNYTLGKDVCQNYSWWVNATGTVGDSYLFYAFANVSTNQSLANQTNTISVLITAASSSSSSSGSSSSSSLMCGLSADGDSSYAAGDECVIVNGFTKTSGNYMISNGSRIIIDNCELSMASSTNLILYDANTKVIVRNGGRICGGSSCG